MQSTIHQESLSKQLQYEDAFIPSVTNPPIKYTVH